MDYYLRYPALTILFYPPLFSVFLAGSYAIFGFSHAVAQGTVAFFHLALGLAVYMLARRWMSHGYAIAAALLLAGAPEIAFWGRQVMLDIPAYAWLALTAVAFLRYLDRGENRYLWLTMILFAAALYTKQTSFFAAFAFTAGIIASQGLRGLPQSSVVGGGCGAAGLDGSPACTAIEIRPGQYRIRIGRPRH